MIPCSGVATPFGLALRYEMCQSKCNKLVLPICTWKSKYECAHVWRSAEERKERMNNEHRLNTIEFTCILTKWNNEWIVYVLIMIASWFAMRLRVLVWRTHCLDFFAFLFRRWVYRIQISIKHFKMLRTIVRCECKVVSSTQGFERTKTLLRFPAQQFQRVDTFLIRLFGENEMKSVLKLILLTAPRRSRWIGQRAAFHGCLVVDNWKTKPLMKSRLRFGAFREIDCTKPMCITWAIWVVAIFNCIVINRTQLNCFFIFYSPD